MKVFFFGYFFLFAFSFGLSAQRTCSSFNYQEDQFAKNPLLRNQSKAIDEFVKAKRFNFISTSGSRGGAAPVLRIPVVVHVLYHNAGENISTEVINSQIKVLNECYRRDNADTAN